MQHTAAEVRHRRVHAGVEQRDPHVPPVDTGHADVRLMSRGRPVVGPRKHLHRDRSGIRDAHRIDRGNIAVRFDNRVRTWIEQRREAVEHAREAVVRPYGDPVQREARDEQALRNRGGARPRAFLSRGRATTVPCDALRKRRRAQYDDHAVSERHRRPRADEAAPCGGARRSDRGSTGASATRRDDDRGRTGSQKREQRRRPALSARHTHRAQDIPGTGRAQRTGLQTRSSPRCPCTARAGPARPRGGPP